MHSSARPVLVSWLFRLLYSCHLDLTRTWLLGPYKHVSILYPGSGYVVSQANDPVSIGALRLAHYTPNSHSLSWVPFLQDGFEASIDVSNASKPYVIRFGDVQRHTDLFT